MSYLLKLIIEESPVFLSLCDVDSQVKMVFQETMLIRDLHNYDLQFTAIFRGFFTVYDSRKNRSNSVKKIVSDDSKECRL